MEVIIGTCLSALSTGFGALIILFMSNAFLIATMTGAIEIVMGLLGFYLTSFVYFLVPYGLAFAAGAMLFIIY